MDEVEMSYEEPLEELPQEEPLPAQEPEEETQEGEETEVAQKPERPAPADADVQAVRLQAQKEAEARLREEFDREIAGTGVMNPYTGEPFRSFREFQEYGEQYRLEQLQEKADAQGRSLEELLEEEENRSYLTQKRREEESRKQAMEALEKQKAALLADALSFQKKYPGVDVAKLEQNQKFRRFCGKRLYQEPLATLYQDYLDLVGDAGAAAVAQRESKARRGTGGGGGGQGVVLSPQQQKALDEWNREYPSLKMTASEFLSR